MKVNFYANYRQVVGAKSIELTLDPGATLQDVIAAIIQLHPGLKPLFLSESGQLQAHVHLFVNGRDSQFLPGGASAVLSTEDKIDIFPPIAGG